MILDDPVRRSVRHHADAKYRLKLQIFRLQRNGGVRHCVRAHDRLESGGVDEALLLVIPVVGRATRHSHAPGELLIWDLDTVPVDRWVLQATPARRIPVRRVDDRAVDGDLNLTVPLLRGLDAGSVDITDLLGEDVVLSAVSKISGGGHRKRNEQLVFWKPLIQR